MYMYMCIYYIYDPWVGILLFLTSLFSIVYCMMLLLTHKNIYIRIADKLVRRFPMGKVPSSSSKRPEVHIISSSKPNIISKNEVTNEKIYGFLKYH